MMRLEWAADMSRGARHRILNCFRLTEPSTAIDDLPYHIVGFNGTARNSDQLAEYTRTMLISQARYRKFSGPLCSWRIR